MNLLKIDDEVVTAEDFIKILKLGDNFSSLLEDIMIDKLTVHAAKKCGIVVSADEIQARVDQFRRIEGLHRAKDTFEYLENMGVNVEEFERHIYEEIIKEKMYEEVTTDDAVNEYFRLHSPKFDSIEISHIVLESEGKAREMYSLLEDDPDSFAQMAIDHSIAGDTKDQGGFLGEILRGQLPDEVEAKAFNAEPGDILGPFPSKDGLYFEIFKLNAKHAARLDEGTKDKVKKMIFEEWLVVRADEHAIEV